MRESKFSDLFGLHKLLNTCRLETPFISRNDEDSEFKLSEVLGWLSYYKKSNKAKIYVLAYFGEIIGCFTVKCDNSSGKYNGYFSIMIKRKYWSRGYGHLVMPLILRCAASLHIRTLYAIVHGTNERALKLYKDFDFEEVLRQVNYYTYKCTHSDKVTLMHEIEV